MADYLAAYGRPRAAGAHLQHTGARLERGEDGFRARTPSGANQAAHVVLATGRSAAPRAAAAGISPWCEGRAALVAGTAGPRTCPRAGCWWWGAGNPRHNWPSSCRQPDARSPWPRRGGRRFLPEDVLGVSVYWWLLGTGILNAGASTPLARFLRHRHEAVFGRQLPGRAGRPGTPGAPSGGRRRRCAAAAGRRQHARAGRGALVHRFRARHRLGRRPGGPRPGRLRGHTAGASPFRVCTWMGLPWQTRVDSSWWTASTATRAGRLGGSRGRWPGRRTAPAGGRLVHRAGVNTAHRRRVVPRPAASALAEPRPHSGAVDLGCEHADLRVERIRTQTGPPARRALEAFADGEDLGLAVRVVHDGTWGFAAGVVHRRGGRPAGRAGRRRRPGVRGDQRRAHRTGAPSRCTPTRPGCPTTRSTRSTSRPREDRRCSTSTPSGCWRPTGSTTCRRGCTLVKEQTFYADTAGTRTPSSGSGCSPTSPRCTVDRATGAFETMRTLAPPAGRGWEYLTGDRLRLAHRARRDARAAAREDEGAVGRGRPLRPRRRPDEPVADHSRVDRPRHRARPRARLRGGLRRHVVRDARQARHAAVRLADDERDRRPHGRARAVDGRLRRRGSGGAEVGHRRATGCSSAISSTGRWRGCSGCRVPTAARSPTPPGHVPVQRMANVSLQPAPDGPTHRGAHRAASTTASTSSATRAGRSTCSATTSSSPASGSSGSRTAGSSGRCAMSRTRRRTTDFWGSMEAVGGPSTYVLGGAFNCGKAQPGQVAPVTHGCPAALFRA